MQKSTIANRIRELRAARTLSQGDLATALGVKQETISKWEAGKTEPSASHIVRLASALGVTTDYLLGVSQHASGIEPNSWIIDLDIVEDLQEQRDLPESVGDLDAWGVAIPRRVKILSSAEYSTLRKHLAPHLARERKRKRTPTKSEAP